MDISHVIGWHKEKNHLTDLEYLSYFGFGRGLWCDGVILPLDNHEMSRHRCHSAGFAAISEMDCDRSFFNQRDGSALFLRFGQLGLGQYEVRSMWGIGVKRCRHQPINLSGPQGRRKLKWWKSSNKEWELVWWPGATDTGDGNTGWEPPPWKAKEIRQSGKKSKQSRPAE